MAKDKKYIITRSNYTVKKTHKKLDTNITVYERDFMITNSNDTWSSGSLPYGTNSFKMVKNTKNSGRYRYYNGEWLKHVDDGQETDIWTYNNIPNNELKNSENNIQLIPNYNSLLDFAYYRSCKDLLETSVTDIIKKFPGELYFTDDKHQLDEEDENNFVYLIENPFEIDLFSSSYKSLIDNDIKIFSQFYDKYVIITPQKQKKCINNWEIIIDNEVVCAKENDLLYSVIITDSDENTYEIHCYFIDGIKTYAFDNDEMIGLRIRPVENVINNFFNNLDDFQSVLLNRNTNPLYTIVLDYPHETERGIETYKKSFTWPVDNEWNIDVNSGEYEKYIKSLLKLCDFYDSRKTDNLWRVMTHDSLKNMDYAFKNDKIESDEYGFGRSKFETIIKCYAKQFDEIKQYIDNIKNSNNITYTNNGNVPNYFLSDKLEMCGWEVYNLANSLNEKSSINGNDIFDNINKIYTVNDINVSLMKNLQINSKNILTRKGTKHGIEMLLGLFGLTSYDSNKNDYDYKISEYVDTITNNTGASIDDVVKYNKLKKTYSETFSGFEINNTDPLQNLPIRMVETENYRYIIPWVDKNQKTDGDIYFQMYGGWCKIFKKDMFNDKKNTDDIVNYGSLSVYDETMKYLLIVNDFIDLKYVDRDRLHNGCIVYVASINDFDEVYVNDDVRNITLNGENNTLKASHYFILNDINNSFTIGSYKKENKTIYGWENITEKEIELSSIESNNERGLRVRLLETIIEDHKGNNPHGGYGKYDDGEDFVNHFRQFFKHAIETNNFNDLAYTCDSGELDENIKNVGFNIQKQKDNVKTWYFTNTLSTENRLFEIDTIKNEQVVDNIMYMGRLYNNCKLTTYSYSTKEQSNVFVGVENNNTFFESDLNPFDFENIGKKHDESCANSIINDKKLLIEFSGPITTNKDFPLFLQNGILPYLKQMIPSTSILEIKIEGEYAEYVSLPYAKSNLEIENK